MKKLTKWLALLTAGLLLFATLIACDGDSEKNPNVDVDADADRAQTEPSPYQNLTPEELLDALLKAEKFTIAEETIFSYGDTPSVSKNTLTKNGDKMSRLSKISADSPSIASESAAQDEIQTGEYIDLANDLIYFQREVGEEWIVQSYTTELEEILYRQSREGLLYNSSTYGEYDPETNRYPMKAEALRTKLSASNAENVEGYMTHKDGVYTFYLMKEYESHRTEETITVTFTADDIQFPAVQVPSPQEIG